MKSYPCEMIVEVSRKVILQKQLQQRFKNVNILTNGEDYSKLIENLSHMIIVANELADIKADEEEG